jgi:hypothetical protein
VAAGYRISGRRAAQNAAYKYINNLHNFCIMMHIKEYFLLLKSHEAQLWAYA